MLTKNIIVKYIAIIFCGIIIFLTLLINLNNQGKYKGIEYNEYITNTNEEMPYSNIIDGNTNSTPIALKSENMLFIPNSEEIIYFDYGIINGSGNTCKVIMQIYYDYKLIKFNVDGNIDYSTQYVFDIKDGERVRIPIHLNSREIKNDNKIHKLLVSFVTGYDKNALDYERVTSEYGLNQLYDVVHTLKFSNEVYVEYESNIIPESNFKYSYDDLIFNTDYNNSAQKLGKSGAVFNPEPQLEIDASETFTLMYNISKEKSQNCLIIITSNFKPMKINGKDYYQLIQLDGNEGTANGSVDVVSPDKSGYYEIIGYVIHNPFIKQNSPDNLIPTSPRFTLVVKE